MFIVNCLRLLLLGLFLLAPLSALSQPVPEPPPDKALEPPPSSRSGQMLDGDITDLELHDLVAGSRLIVLGKVFSYSWQKRVGTLYVEEVISGKFSEKMLVFVCPRADLSVSDIPLEISGESVVRKKEHPSRIWFLYRPPTEKNTPWELLRSGRLSSLSPELRAEVELTARKIREQTITDRKQRIQSRFNQSPQK